jgi:hypothetical protein
MNSKKICGILDVRIVCAFNHAVRTAGTSARISSRMRRLPGQGIGNGARDIGHATKHVASRSGMRMPRTVGHGAAKSVSASAWRARAGMRPGMRSSTCFTRAIDGLCRSWQ